MYAPVMSGNGFPNGTSAGGSSSSSSASSASPSGVGGGSKRERRRDSGDFNESLGRAVQLNAAHQLQQQQAGVHHQPLLQPSSHGGLYSSPSASPAAPGSPLRSPAGAARLHPSPSRMHSAGNHNHYTPPSHPLPHQPLPVPSAHHSAGPGSPYVPSQPSLPAHPPGSSQPFPFPHLLSLNRSRLLHLLDFQIRLSSAPSDESRLSSPAVDGPSAAHYAVLASCIRSLHLAGGVFSFSFVAGTSVAEELLGRTGPTQIHFGSGADGGAAGGVESKASSRLTALHLLECLAEIRNSPSATLASPQELPPALLDAGVYYLPEAHSGGGLSMAPSPQALLSPFVYHRALALLALLLNLHMHQLTLAKVLRMLQGIERHLKYWERHQDIGSLPKPYRLLQWVRFKRSGGGAAGGGGKASSASPGPAQRMNPYRNWSKMAARNVRDLLELKRLWTGRCGRLCLRMHRIQEWLSASFSKSAVPPHGPSVPPSASRSSVTSTAAPAPLFHAQIAANQRYFARLYFYVTREELQLESAHDPHAAAHGAPIASIEARILSLQSLLSQFDRFLQVLETRFERDFAAAIDRRRKPHHLFEYWHLYASAAVVIVGGAVLAYRHQEKVRSALGEAWVALKEFAYEHAQEPLQNIWDSVSSTFQDRSLFSTNAQALRQSKKDLSRMLENFAGHHVKELSRHEHVSPAEYQSTLPSRAAAGDMSLVMHTYEREIQRPIRSMLFGDLLRGLLIQVQKVKIDGEAAMLAADQVLKSNNINFNVLATIPVLLLGYVTVDFVNKWILRSSWSSKKVREKVRQSKAILSELEQLYILHLPNGGGASAYVAPAALPFSPSGLGPSPPSLPLSLPRRRSTLPSLHSRFASLRWDEWASLASQEVEAEDEALRMAAPEGDEEEAAEEEEQEGKEGREERKEGPSSKPRPRRSLSKRSLNSDVFSSSASRRGSRSSGLLTPPAAPAAAAGDIDASQPVSDEEGDEMLEEFGAVAGATPGVDGVDGPAAAGAAGRGGAGGRNLFPPSATAASASLAPSSASCALSLSNHAYGHSLLLVHQLSLLFASLPLASAFSPASGFSSSDASDPRSALHKDLLLLASHELTPEQKMRWIQQMFRGYDFLQRS